MGSTAEQMRFIHQVLLHSRMQGFTGLPRLAYTKTGETLLLLDNLWFEAQEWLTGGPLYGLETPLARQRTPNIAIAAASDLIAEGYWSLEQLKLERLPAHEKAAHWHNLRMLLSSVEALVEELS